MKKLKLDIQFLDRYKKFASSDLFDKQPKYSKSNYWEFHSKQIKFNIKDSYLFLEGQSGNYIPEIKYFCKKNTNSKYICTYRFFKNANTKIF